MDQEDIEKDKPKLPANLKITAEEHKMIIDHLNKYPEDVLHIPRIRYGLTRSRFKRVEEAKAVDFKNKQIFSHTIQHNFQNMSALICLNRPDVIIRPLLSIPYIVSNVKNLKVLTIGPRTEAEIFSLIAIGFEIPNIYAIDLISYTDFIKIGDMHNIPFDDNVFDVVIMGWVLAYSSDNQRAADEVMRVAKPGAHISIGCDFEPLREELRKEIKEAVGGLPVENLKTGVVASRFFHCGQIIKLFKGHIDEILFKQTTYPSVRDKYSLVMALFRLK